MFGRFVRRAAMSPVGKFWRRATGAVSDGRQPSLTKHDARGLRCAIAHNKHGAYCVPDSSSHRPASRVILRGDVYEPDTIDFMALHGGDGDIVHAGTFFGDFIPALSRAVGAAGLVWAFEPNTENYRCARITCELNDVSNVRLTRAALGSRRGNSFVRIADATGQSLGGASEIVARDSNAPTEPVDVLTIDDVIPVERKIGILQLDVEGYEKEALMGGMRTMRRCLPTLILEVRPNSNLVGSSWFASNILELGYERGGQLHANHVYRVGAAATRA